MVNADSLEWDKMSGLIPAIVQDAHDGRVLMQAWMNRDALERTVQSGHATFWSRSRETLWTKGETSGNYLDVKAIRADCDGDCLLLIAQARGPTCHRGTDTCFDGEEPALAQVAFLARLEGLIGQRHAGRPEGSYTTTLFESGLKRIAQKVGEEGVETALAGVDGSDAELLGEAADLVYHLLVLLRARGLALPELVATLESRHAAKNPPPADARGKQAET